MKQSNFSVFVLLVLLAPLILAGCGFSGGSNPAASIKNDFRSGNEFPAGTKELPGQSVEEYQLISILGHYPMHGGFYEFDEKSSLWCERPMAADMMAYARQHDIEDPNDVPDLSSFFDQETTRLFNSCKLKMIGNGDYTAISLEYDGKTVYQNSLKKSKIPAGGKYEIKVKSIANLDWPEQNGTMLFSEAGNYVISIGGEPEISFSNEFGQYFLKFRRL